MTVVLLYVGQIISDSRHTSRYTNLCSTATLSNLLVSWQFACRFRTWRASTYIWWRVSWWSSRLCSSTLLCLISATGSGNLVRRWLSPARRSRAPTTRRFRRPRPPLTLLVPSLSARCRRCCRRLLEPLVTGSAGSTRTTEERAAESESIRRSDSAAKHSTLSPEHRMSCRYVVVAGCQGMTDCCTTTSWGLQ